MLKKVVICLRLGSIFTLLVGCYLLYLALTDKEVVFTGIVILFFVCIGLVIWYEFTIKGLKKFKSWAWKSSIVIFGAFIPSASIIMGIIGMQAVLSNTMREQIFGKKENGDQEKAKSFAEIMSEDRHIIKDESVEEYIEKNDALQRYMKYKKITDEK